MNIPPAALEAGARALCNEQRLFWPDLTKDEHDIIRGEARAAFLAMVEAWPKMLEQQFYELTPDGNRITFPAIILPLPTQENEND